jgi:hypothetical protein
MSLVFTGEAVVTGCDGLGYPGAGNSGIPSALPGTTVQLSPTPTITVHPDGETCNFTFWSNTCAGADVSTKAMAPPPLCTMAAWGGETGYCSYFSGHVDGTIDFGFDPLRTTLDFSVDYWSSSEKWTGTGTVWKRTTGQGGTMAMEVAIQRPNPLTAPAGGSCLTSTAVYWHAAGSAVAVLT